jgi:4-diphosphocytidyl-2-C-methyl-D-erythritol kinase
MVVFPNAKINLGLNILRKRPDGYHDISTVFYPIGLSDILEITKQEKPGVEWVNTGLEIDCPAEKNLAVKAYNLLHKEFDLPGVIMQLHKIIPFGAGLGGGSADAAFALTALNSFFELNISTEKLAVMAATLGSDCAFFVYNRPCKASGRGEILEPVDLSLKGKYLLLIKPDVYVSTAQAYAGVTPRIPLVLPEEAISQPVEKWKDLLINDFEESVFRQFSQLGELRDKLYAVGAFYAAMSGSGSSIFGLFDSEPPQIEGIDGLFVWKELLE